MAACGEQDIAILIGIGVAGFVLGVVVLPILQGLFGGAKFEALARSAITLIMIGVFLTIAAIFVRSTFPSGFGSVVPAILSFVADYPFSITLLGAFATLNGLFFYLMRAPTALGRPIMDQLAGFKLYLETAESGQLNLQAPEITAQRFEAILPYAVALDVEEPWAQAFAAALRRAHPDDTDPMHHY